MAWTITSNTNQLIAKLRASIQNTAPTSPKIKEALTRIGLFVTAAAKIEARQKGIIDSGRLISSLRYEFFKIGGVQGIRVGSFGVPYAAMHEFGGTFTDAMRKAMFANMAKRGRKARQSKNIIVGNRFKARPYLRPALFKSRIFIIDTLRAAMKFAAE